MWHILHSLQSLGHLSTGTFHAEQSSTRNTHISFHPNWNELIVTVYRAHAPQLALAIEFNWWQVIWGVIGLSLFIFWFNQQRKRKRFLIFIFSLCQEHYESNFWNCKQIQNVNSIFRFKWSFENLLNLALWSVLTFSFGTFDCPANCLLTTTIWCWHVDRFAKWKEIQIVK